MSSVSNNLLIITKTNSTNSQPSRQLAKHRPT